MNIWHARPSHIHRNPLFSIGPYLVLIHSCAHRVPSIVALGMATSNPRGVEIPLCRNIVQVRRS